MDVDTGNPVVVIDNGSYMCSGGFSGDDAPKECIPTIVETSVEPTEPRTEHRVSTNYTVYNEAPHHVNLKCPISHGVVTDWDGMEKVRLSHKCL